MIYGRLVKKVYEDRIPMTLESAVECVFMSIGGVLIAAVIVAFATWLWVG